MGVELVGVNRTEGPAEFDLAWSAWDEVRELAQAHGWVPGRPGWRCKRSPEEEAENEAVEASKRADLKTLEGLPEPNREGKLRMHQLRLALAFVREQTQWVLWPSGVVGPRKPLAQKTSSSSRHTLTTTSSYLFCWGCRHCAGNVILGLKDLGWRGGYISGRV